MFQHLQQNYCTTLNTLLTDTWNYWDFLFNCWRDFCPYSEVDLLTFWMSFVPCDSVSREWSVGQVYDSIVAVTGRLCIECFKVYKTWQKGGQCSPSSCNPISSLRHKKVRLMHWRSSSTTVGDQGMPVLIFWQQVARFVSSEHYLSKWKIPLSLQPVNLWQQSYS